jgi:hypothetical protein
MRSESAPPHSGAEAANKVPTGTNAAEQQRKQIKIVLICEICQQQGHDSTDSFFHPDESEDLWSL